MGRNHALAFIGDTLSPKGEKVPERLSLSYRKMKLAGKRQVMRRKWNGNHPARATAWRRAATFNFTHHRAYPGLVNVPRHWVRLIRRVRKSRF